MLVTKERKKAHFNGCSPANNESGVVFPTQAARIHVRPQADIVAQHICNSLFCADVIDFNALRETKETKL